MDPAVLSPTSALFANPADAHLAAEGRPRLVVCQATDTFLTDEQTLRSWIRRVDEEGERALIQIPVPVNKFPDFARYLVKQLKILLPTMGKVRIAQVLARAGLHLGATTVGRILRETGPIPDDATSAAIGIDNPHHRTEAVSPSPSKITPGT